MAFKIVRNDITRMDTEAIVNTANDYSTVGSGCDRAVYNAAGYDQLLAYRKEKIGFVPEGDAFITPGFNLKAKYIIHAVSPMYMGGSEGEEEKLRSCYRKSLKLAKENGIRSISFPLISTGSFGYPKEEGMRIAVDEIHTFLLNNEMDIFLVVFDEKSKSLGKRIVPDLEEYIDQRYVRIKHDEEYGMTLYREIIDDYDQDAEYFTVSLDDAKEYHWLTDDLYSTSTDQGEDESIETVKPEGLKKTGTGSDNKKDKKKNTNRSDVSSYVQNAKMSGNTAEEPFIDFEEMHVGKLNQRMRHISDTFSQYLMYLIQDRKMDNAEVYKRAIVDKKTFSKIKNNEDYHPQKLTALCLCIGAKLNLDEARDLLARAGYALSPCDKTDIIFSYFIENEIYDMIELDIQLEEHGLPCIIT